MPTVNAPTLWRCSEPFCAYRNPVQRIANHLQVVASGLGDEQALTLAIEELKTEFGLQRLNLMTDGALRHAQLLSRPRETLVAGSRLKSSERIEWRQAPRHGVNHHQKIY